MVNLNMKDKPSRDERTRAYKVAALADCDPRTALKALREGPDTIRGAHVRERIVAAMGSAA